MTRTRNAASAVDRALRFVRDERGGGGALAAAMITMMAMGGAALIVDHVQLVGTRDLVKTAADATAMAARLELGKLPRSMSDAEVLAHFDRTSTKYAQLNILGNLRLPDLGPEDIAVAYSLDRGAGTVDATIEADIDLSLMTDRMYGYAGPERMRSLSGVVAEAPVTVVLAIDASNSMLMEQAPGVVIPRLRVVQRAAHEVVRILGPNAHDPVEIGLVPWAQTACVAAADCDRFHGRDWPPALPPSTSPEVVVQAIDGLVANGGATRSAIGVSVAWELLDAASGDNRKALVLLTDGEDNLCARADGRLRNCGEWEASRQRGEACAAAKGAGIEIFVIAAMPPDQVSERLAQGLRDCSSEGEREGRYVFINNATPEALEAAFVNIANQLRVVRRVY